jgi:hypothetical protein
MYVINVEYLSKMDLTISTLLGSFVLFARRYPETRTWFRIENLNLIYKVCNRKPGSPHRVLNDFLCKDVWLKEDQRNIPE